MTKFVEARPGTAIGPPPAEAFRNAMAAVPSAVHLVTTLGPTGRAGLTATAIASVSDLPPTVLACISRDSSTLAAITASGIFCINTLQADAAGLAEIFAGRSGLAGEARFGSALWSQLVTGAPALPAALAIFDCRLVAIHDAATHRILVGEVVGLGGTGVGEGLVYRGRGYSGR